MMRNGRAPRAEDELPAAVSAAALFLGSVIGAVFAARVGYSDPAAEAVRALFSEGAEGVPFAALALRALFYPAVAFLLGFFLPGAAIIPVFAALRGFSAGFSAALVMRALGIAGLSPALPIYLTLILSLPVFILAAAMGIRASAALMRGAFSGGVYSIGYFSAAALCVILLCAAAALCKI